MVSPESAASPDPAASAETAASPESRSPRFWDVRRLKGWGRNHWVAAISLTVGMATVTTFFAIGAWQRRWIADDGLIVLRTLLNLLAGNGPVFNAGERVEANTSTAWTYLLWFWAWITDGQVEYVALWVAIVLSVAAIPIAILGTARLYGARRGGLTAAATLVLPFGAIVYITIPPARDFATSGLENGLVIFWIAVLWWGMVSWGAARVGDNRPARSAPGAGDNRPARSAPGAGENRPGQASRRHISDSEPVVGGFAGWATLLLAFWAGLAPLIRPELAVLGALALLLIVGAPLSWRMRLGVVAVAGILPIGYQIFRMGYYALLVPNPAVAKDASGSKWGQGFVYLGNLFGPYLLVLPTILAIVAAVVLVLIGRGDAGSTTQKASLEQTDTQQTDTEQTGPEQGRTVAERIAAYSARLQSPSAVVAVVVTAGLILGTYWIRQGGDFMHGRVLLSSVFILLLPVMVLPIALPSLQPKRIIAAVVLAAVWITTLVWSIGSNQNTLPNAGIDIGRSGIVDERRFYVTNMGNPNPITAEDYLDYPRMQAMVDAIEKYHDRGAVILPSGDYDHWYIAQLPDQMPEGATRRVTVYFLNLGMTGMNAPLDVRVIDQMGLAYPLAAHTERLTDGRIGHDKTLPSEWIVAEAGASAKRPVLPAFLDEDTVRQAQVALTCEDTRDRFASFAETWSWDRFQRNLRQAVGFTDYRIEREPEYELQRCGLPKPPPVAEEPDVATPPAPDLANPPG